MELLERYFEIALETLDGIKKLRELILTLAMQGKLVPQDRKEQPASELLKEIENAKFNLVKSGKIKKQEPLEPIKPKEIPYALPKGWEWIQLGLLLQKYGAGSTPSGGKKVYQQKGIIFLRSQNIWNDGLRLDDVARIVENIHEKMAGTKVFGNDILLNITGASIGRSAIYPLNFEDANVSQHVAILRLIDVRSVFFIHKFITSPFFQKMIMDKQVGVSREGLSMNKLKDFICPIPPLAEQKRIVAKIDQLMALCDKLESERNERNQKRLKVHSAAMGNLLSAPEKETFNKSWKFITNNFNELYSVQENIAELKKAILQLAVIGKLVKQDPKDQPARELLKEIDVEKKRLIVEGKIRKQEVLPAVKADEIPYEVPNGWEWVRFFEINIVKSELVRPEDYLNEKQIAPDSIEKGSGKLLFDRTVLESGVKGPNNRFYKGQILYSKIRPSLSKAVIAPYDGLCSADMYPIETFIYLDFTLKALLSETFLVQVRKAENRVKMPKLNLESLSVFLFPLPPLAEQKRIVAKIDQLMDFCNSLEVQMKGSTEKQTAILDAVLAGR